MKQVGELIEVEFLGDVINVFIYALWAYRV